ncbi:glial cell line derived neurotrophic factor family receptor alpha 2, partial [Triplophysa rosa]
GFGWALTVKARHRYPDQLLWSDKVLTGVLKREFMWSRLADFHTNCQMTPHSVSSCLNDDYQACLASYTRLIGTDMTPNYVDSGHSNFTISPWCTCRGSGNQEEECEKFLQDFRENTCLRNAIQAFGYGSKPDPQPTSDSIKPDLVATANVPKTTMEPGEEPCIISSCANLHELGEDCYPSKDYICESEVRSGRKLSNPPNTRVEDPRNSSPGTKALTDVFMLCLLFAFGILTI